MKWLFSPKALIIISWVMMLGGIVGMVLTRLKLIASEEPELVLHLSFLAISVTGYGNIISAHINRHLKEK